MTGPGYLLTIAIIRRCAGCPGAGGYAMEQYISSYVASNLYWYGRHLQRIETTLIDVLELFDTVINADKKAGEAYFKEIEIELEYDHALHFLNEALFGTHPSNIAELMFNAQENAIICRKYIDKDAFGETIRLKRFIDTAKNRPGGIDYRFIGESLSLINEIWGIMSRGLIREKSDHMIRLGKLTEKVDLHLRHGRDKNESVIYLHNILITAQRITPEAELCISDSHHETSLNAINALIDSIIVP